MVAANELDTEQFSRLPLVPASPGEDATDGVDPRIGSGQRAAQHSRLGSSRQIPYHENHPQAVPATDLIDAAEPIEIVEPICLQRLNRNEPVLRGYLDHDGTRPAI